MNDLFNKITDSYKNIYSQLRVTISILSLFIGVSFFYIKYISFLNPYIEHSGIINSLLICAIFLIISSIVFLIMALDVLNDTNSEISESKNSELLSTSTIRTYKSLAFLLSGIIFEVFATGILIYKSFNDDVYIFIIVLLIAIAVGLIILNWERLEKIIKTK